MNGVAALVVRPRSFAMVMATGIVSSAVRQAGWPAPSAVLLVVAAAAFAVLVALAVGQTAARPARWRADLAPDTAFSWFAVVAAAGVLADRLDADGHRGPADVLAILVLAGWLVLTCTLPVLLTVRLRPAPAASGPGQGAPGQGSPAQGAPGQGAPGQAGPAQTEPAQSAPGQGAPGRAEPAQNGSRAPIRADPASPGPGQAQPGQGGPVRSRPLIAEVNGSWLLWVVGTQAMTMAVVLLASAGLVPAGPAALAAVAAWCAGAVLYLVILTLVLARLLLAGLGPGDATAPYWVAMGAAAITVLAATQVLHLGGGPAGVTRPVLTGLAVLFWSVASWLILPLTALSAWRVLHRPRRLGFLAELWMAVFPLGMYAMAGMRLGVLAGLPDLTVVGRIAVWPAAAAWVLTCAAMLGSGYGRIRRQRGQPPRPRPVPRAVAKPR